jgi:hypothetical protein
MSDVIPFGKKPINAAIEGEGTRPFLEGSAQIRIDDWVIVDDETCPYPALCGSTGKVALILDGFVSIINEQDGLWLPMLPAAWVKHA